MKIKVGVVSIGFKNFRYDIAKSYLNQTMDRIQSLNVDSIFYPTVAMDIQGVNEALSYFENEKVDMILLQIGTFPMGEMAMHLLSKIAHTPLFLWGFEDPVVDTYNTIPLNSLTGMTMITSYLKRMRIKFSYGYGAVDSDVVWGKIGHMVRALYVKKQLSIAKFAVIGTRAPGFYLCEVNQVAFKQKVGVSVEYYSVGDLVVAAKAISQDRVDQLRVTLEKTVSVDGTRERFEKNIRVYLAVKDLIRQEGITALSIKCWPEWQSQYGISVCPVLAMLNDDGVMTSCEGDIPGLTTMYIQYLLTNQPPFFADLVNISRAKVLKAWHCGHAPLKLSNGPVSFIEHPTMRNGLGLAVQFDMITSERITMAKLSEYDNDYRLFFTTGKSVSPDRFIEGPQTDLVLDKSIDDVLDLIVENGIEHHFSIAHQDLTDDFLECCKWMDWKVIR